MGVVIDFGKSDINISKSKFKIFDKKYTEIKEVSDPTKTPTNIGIKCFFNRCNCLYKGKARTIVAGPRKNFI